MRAFLAEPDLELNWRVFNHWLKEDKKLKRSKPHSARSCRSNDCLWHKGRR